MFISREECRERFSAQRASPKRPGYTSSVVLEGFFVRQCVARIWFFVVIASGPCICTTVQRYGLDDCALLRNAMAVGLKRI